MLRQSAKNMAFRNFISPGASGWIPTPINLKIYESSVLPLSYWCTTNKAPIQAIKHVKVPTAGTRACCRFLPQLI
jgi:hypothetical protein